MSEPHEENESLVAIATSFEDCSHQNGMCYWLDTDLMRFLGYTDYASFRKIILKAISSCAGLEMDPFDDFKHYEEGESDHGAPKQYKLSRLACFLITQQADASKQEVRMMQYCLARMADTLLGSKELDRLEARGKLVEEEKTMTSTAKRHGVQDYACFKDAGYRGMYNMPLSALKRRKGFSQKNGTLYDRMGNVELVANLFRVTQTNERITSKGITGQHSLEQAAHDVGRTVRQVMIENTGKTPESLPLAPTEIRELKKEGKRVVRNIRKIDSDDGKKGKK